jgi:proteasome accessory factor C
MAEASIARTSRILDMVPFLGEHQGISLSDLSQHFGVSEKQIYEDLNLIFVCGVPGYLPDDLIDISFEEGFVTVSNPQKLDRPRSLNYEEVSTLLLALEVLNDVLDPEKQKSLMKLAHKLRTEFKVGHDIEIIPSDSYGDEIAIIEEAISKRIAIGFSYLSTNSDSLTKREVLPTSVSINTSEIYLFGIEIGSQILKSFRFSRMKELQILSEREVPEAAESSVESKVNNPMTARIEIRSGAHRLLEEDGGVIRIVSESSGTIIGDIEYWTDDWLFRRLRSFAPNVRILEPLDLNEAFLARVRGALAPYQP